MIVTDHTLVIYDVAVVGSREEIGFFGVDSLLRWYFEKRKELPANYTIRMFVTLLDDDNKSVVKEIKLI